MSTGGNIAGQAAESAVRAMDARYMRLQVGEPSEEAQRSLPVPTSFRVTTYWKRKRAEPGPTYAATRRLDLGEALDWVLGQLSEDECTVETDGDRTVITIDWSRVPDEVRDPFSHGVRR